MFSTNREKRSIKTPEVAKANYPSPSPLASSPFTVLAQPFSFRSRVAVLIAGLTRVLLALDRRRPQARRDRRSLGLRAAPIIAASGHRLGGAATFKFNSQNLPGLEHDPLTARPSRSNFCAPDEKICTVPDGLRSKRASAMAKVRSRLEIP
jgi:hypothetical protein